MPAMPRPPDRILPALAWRYACHASMLALALFNESRPAPRLTDAVLSVTPYLDWVSAYNYHLWLALYAPVALALWRRDRARFVHFLYVGGLLSLLRGVTINLTALGPIDGPDANAGLDLAQGFAAWLNLVNPLPTLTDGAAAVHLTKDLFFSGHTATTFLLYLYCRPLGRLGGVALAAHAAVVVVVFVSRLHYTIDVVGAWAITYAVFAWTTARWVPAATFGAAPPVRDRLGTDRLGADRLTRRR